MCVGTALLAAYICRRQLALASKDEDQKQARIHQLEENTESLRREMKDHEGTPSVHYSIGEVYYV